MRAIAASLSFATLLLASLALAQDNPPTQEAVSQNVASPTAPNFNAVYCAGFYTDEKMPSDVRLISGEESNNRLIFTEGNYVLTAALRKVCAWATAFRLCARTLTPTKCSGSNGNTN